MTRQKILIIDDSKIIRLQVRDMLPQGNFEVFEAKDGQEGLDLIKQEHPGLVVIDFFMPNMNGWEVVQRMQADPVLSAIPVVMMSGRQEDVVAAVPELFEYFEFLSKPFDAPVLMKAIKGAMVKAKERKQSRIAIPAAKTAAVPGRSPLPAATPVSSANKPSNRSEANELIEMLRSDIQQLQHQNAQLQTEVNTLKKQLTQLVSFVRKKLS